MKQRLIEGVGSHTALYQPVSPLPWQLTSDVEYYELLSRVAHPGGWLWSSEELFCCPHRTLAIDLAVLDQASCALRDHPETRFGINAAPTSLMSESYMEALEFVAAQLDDPSRLILEMTETFSAEGGAIFALIERLERVHEMGVRVALDDFGTGGAGLAAFSMFPFNYIKFAPIVDVTNDRGRAVLEAMVDAANSMGDFTIVLEGVESQHMLNVANDVGAFCAQGFHIGRPAPVPTQPPALTLQPSLDGDLAAAVRLTG